MATMAPTKPWVCPTCQTSIVTPYCPSCGERLLTPRDLTLRGLGEQYRFALLVITLYTA